MLFIILFHIVQSTYLTTKSIEVTVNSSYFETTPFEEAINFFNEFYTDGYPCISQQINSLTSIPTDLNGTLNILSKCISPFQLNYNIYSSLTIFHHELHFTHQYTNKTFKNMLVIHLNLNIIAISILILQKQALKLNQNALFVL